MNFSCGKCGRTYSVADEKVRGRSFKVKCRGCDFVIVVKPSPVTQPQPQPQQRQPTPPPVLSRAEADPAEAVPPPDPSEHAAAVAMAEEEIRQRTGGEPRTADGPPTLGTFSPLPERQEAVESVPASGEEQLIDGGARGLPDLMNEPAMAVPLAAADGKAAANTGREPRASRRPVVLALAGILTIALCGLVYFLFSRQPTSPVRRAQPAVAVPVPPPKPQPEPPTPKPLPEPLPTPEPPPTAAPEPDLGKLLARPKTDPQKPALPGGEDSAVATGKLAGGNKTRLASVGPEEGEIQKRDKVRARSIKSKDKKLLDLVGRTADSAPVEPIERRRLDTSAQLLDEEQIAQTFADNRKAFDACYTRALRQDPNLRPDGYKVVVSVVIQPSGLVSDSSLSDRQLDQSGLGGCLKGVCGRLVFPAFEGGPIQVDAPLVLNRVE